MIRDDDFCFLVGGEPPVKVSRALWNSCIFHDVWEQPEETGPRRSRTRFTGEWTDDLLFVSADCCAAHMLTKASQVTAGSFQGWQTFQISKETSLICGIRIEDNLQINWGVWTAGSSPRFPTNYTQSCQSCKSWKFAMIAVVNGHLWKWTCPNISSPAHWFLH